MLHAVEDINLDIHRGETLGLVGESGCGKSTLGRTLMGIYQPTKGKLVYDGRPVDLSNKKDRFAFAEKAQIVFQDPYASLDPRMTVGSIIVDEPWIIHNMYKTAKRRQERVAELLATVGLNREHANRYPARVFRRPASAHRHCPRAGHRAGIHRLRRADFRAGCVDSGTGHQPAARFAGADGADVSVHRARSERSSNTSPTASR